MRRALVQVTLLITALVVLLAVVRAATAYTRLGRDAIALTPEAVGLPYEDVSLVAVDGVPLSGWYVQPPAKPTRVALLLHGAVRDRTDREVHLLDLAQRLYQQGFGVLLFDQRAHGRSGGTSIGLGWLEWQDVAGALRFLEARGIATTRVAIVGYSTGGVAALVAAANGHPAGALVADSPYVTPLELLPSRSPLLLPVLLYGELAIGAPLGNPDLRALAARIDGRRVMLIQGTDDDRVPPDNAPRLATAIDAAELWLVPKAHHVKSFVADPVEYVRRIVAFVAPLLEQ